MCQTSLNAYFKRIEKPKVIKNFRKIIKMNINNDMQDIEPIVDDVIENEENLNGSMNKIEISEQFILVNENDDENNVNDGQNLVSTSSPHPPSTSPVPHDFISQHKETMPPPPSTPPLLSQEELPPPPPPPPPASINGQTVKPKSQLKRSFSAKPLTTTSNYRPFSSRLENSNQNQISNNYFMNQDSLSHTGSNNMPLFITHVTLNLDVPSKGLNKPSIPSWKYNTVRKNCANYSYSALLNKK